jgi:multidrug efflux system outer membrane protein
MQRVVAVVLIALAVGGCMVGPPYQRPAVETPEAWRVDYPRAAEVANTEWWRQFGDPVLDDLIATALRENRDIRIAAARVDQFIGALTATQSQLFPQVGYGADATRARASRLGRPPVPEPISPYFNLYSAALSASWQLDLFGRVRSLSEAAQAQVYASEQGQRGVVLSVVSGVATAYIFLRAFDRQLEIAQATAANFGETARIFRLRFKSGLVSMTEVSQVESQLKQAEAAIPLLRQQIATQENLISILLGRNPGPIPRGKSIDQLVPPLIPEDLPAVLLARRPDILQAEQNLIAANANIGAARALYFPQFSITGAFGSASTAFGNFFTGPATTWALIGGVTGPIFTFGAIRGQVFSAEAQTRAATELYQQTILNAFRETNDALVGSQEKVIESQAQQERIASLREFARLSKLRFDRGIASYLDVLVAENELFAAELAGVRVQAERYAQLVNVYQAMGGGWVDIATAQAPQPQGIVGRALPLF